MQAAARAQKAAAKAEQQRQARERADRLRDHLGDDAKARRKAVEDMVYGFVRDRMELLRLTPEERALWKRALGEMRDKGNAILDRMKAAGNPSYADFEGCPMCDGAGRAAGN